MPFIRAQDNFVVEVFSPILLDGTLHKDPRPLFHPDVGWIEIAENAVVGDGYVDGELFPRPEHAEEFDPETKTWKRDLAAIKADRIAAIDTRTAELINRGFSFAGSQFSMSEAAQRNWIALSSGLANSLLSFPMPVSTIDESSHVLQSADALKAFLGAYLLYQADPNQPLGAGRSLKERITAAATVEEVEAVVDDRE